MDCDHSRKTMSAEARKTRTIFSVGISYANALRSWKYDSFDSNYTCLLPDELSHELSSVYSQKILNAVLINFNHKNWGDKSISVSYLITHFISECHEFSLHLK